MSKERELGTIIRTRISPEQKRQLEAVASVRQLPTAAMVREYIREGLSRDYVRGMDGQDRPEPSPVPPPEAQPELSGVV